MIIRLFSIYDKKTQLFGQMFPAHTPGAAERMFSQEVNRTDSNNMMNAHPDDFALFEIAHWDDSNGQFTEIATPPRLIVEAGQVFKSPD